MKSKKKTLRFMPEYISMDSGSSVGAMYLYFIYIYIYMSAKVYI